MSCYKNKPTWWSPRRLIRADTFGLRRKGYVRVSQRGMLRLIRVDTLRRGHTVRFLVERHISGFLRAQLIYTYFALVLYPCRMLVRFTISVIQAMKSSWLEILDVTIEKAVQLYRLKRSSMAWHWWYIVGAIWSTRDSSMLWNIYNKGLLNRLWGKTGFFTVDNWI